MEPGGWKKTPANGRVPELKSGGEETSSLHPRGDAPPQWRGRRRQRLYDLVDGTGTGEDIAGRPTVPWR